MKMPPENEFKPDWTICLPTGTLLLEEMKARGLTFMELSNTSGIPETELVDFCYWEAPLTDEIASGLEKALGISAQFWIRLEAYYRRA